MATVIENHGPPANRVNYIIVGDGYSPTGAGEHVDHDVNNSMTRRFSEPNGVPYNRYRNFSTSAGCRCRARRSAAAARSVAAATTAAGSRTATTARSTPRSSVLPASSDRLQRRRAERQQLVEQRRHADVLVGRQQGRPGAAMHEGGHGFHQLADEYGTCTGAKLRHEHHGTGTTGTVYAEVNSAGNPMTTDGKWDMWIGFNATGRDRASRAPVEAAATSASRGSTGRRRTR